MQTLKRLINKQKLQQQHKKITNNNITFLQDSATIYAQLVTLISALKCC